MVEPWFDAGFVGGIAGSLVGTLGGLWGALSGTLAPRGKGKRLVLGGMLFFSITGIASLLLGVVAICVGQPFPIYYVFLLLGAILTIVFTPLIFVIRNVYATVELRKMTARDLS